MSGSPQCALPHRLGWLFSEASVTAAPCASAASGIDGPEHLEAEKWIVTLYRVCVCVKNK